MSTPSMSMLSAMPQTQGISDDTTAASPILQALLSQVGGSAGLQNTDSLAAANPEMGQALSLMTPGGGLSPSQASQFGPMFALMMSLQGGQ